MRESFGIVHEMFRESSKNSSDPTTKNAGTTALISYITVDKFYIANLGDTRGTLPLIK